MTEDEVLEIAEANLKNLHADLQRLIDISRIMGRRAERDRIIQRIENTYEHNEEPYCYRCDFLVLVKGEAE